LSFLDEAKPLKRKSEVEVKKEGEKRPKIESKDSSDQDTVTTEDLSGFASSMSLAEGARSVFDLSELDWVFTATESLGSFFTFFLGGTGSSFLMNS
jgi:ethanolamine utilization protein EutQ (cupin superfamily)